MPTYETFRVRLRQAMRADPRYNAEIAHASGYALRHIERVCAGTKCNPTLAFVDTMATTLSVSPLWLLGSNE